MSHISRCMMIKDLLRSTGVDLHEEQCGPVLTALGWEWHPDGTFVCQLTNYNVVYSFVQSWCLRIRANRPILVKDLMSVTGLLYWISSACLNIVPLIHVLHQAAYKCSHINISLDERCSYSVFAIWDFITTWNRCSPVFQGFSPACSWQSLVRTDASSSFGCGGFILPMSLCFSHSWSQIEREVAFVDVFQSSTLIELLGIEYALTNFGHLMRGQRVQFELDSEVGHRDLIRSFSPKPLILGCVHRIRTLCSSLSIIPRFEHIKRIFNPIADLLATGNTSQAISLGREQLSVDLLLIKDGQFPLGDVPKPLLLKSYMDSFQF